MSAHEADCFLSGGDDGRWPCICKTSNMPTSHITVEEIATKVADGCVYKRGTDNYARVWQGARLGALEARAAILASNHSDAEDEAFCAAVWGALKGDHNDLRRQQIILKAHRAARGEVA